VEVTTDDGPIDVLTAARLAADTSDPHASLHGRLHFRECSMASVRVVCSSFSAGPAGVGSFSSGGGVIVVNANGEDSVMAMKGAFNAKAVTNGRSLLFCCCILVRIGAKCCHLER